MRKMLIIDDDEDIVSIIKEEAQKLKIDVFAFIPLSRERVQSNRQLSELCTERTFDFALVDFDLWGALMGTNFTETLNQHKIKFVAFSSDFRGNNLLLEDGAICSIPKDYNSRGFDKQKLANGLAELLKT